MNYKKLAAFLISFVGTASIASTFVAEGSGNFNHAFSANAYEECMHVGNYYDVIDATETNDGHIGYYICCKCHEVFTEQPIHWTTSSISYNDSYNLNDFSLNGVRLKANWFSTKFTNNDKYLYKVGNKNSFNSKLIFPNADSIKLISSSSNITLDSDDPTKIKFTGTGVAVISPIVNGYYNSSYNINVEVIDATNSYSGSLSYATSSDVVLLEDVGFSSYEIKNNHVLYGNGFKMTCSVDSPSLDMSYGFVTVKNGTIDNTQIICPNFDRAALYQSQYKNVSSWPTQVEGEKTRYYRLRSGVIIDENASIYNSFISGGRAAVYLKAAYDVLLDNTTISGGAVANIQVSGFSNLTLKDVTTIQNELPVTGSTTNQKILGFGVLVQSASGKIVLENTLTQYNWLSKELVNTYLPDYSSLTDELFKQEEFIHTYNGVDYVNSGILYNCDWDINNAFDNIASNLKVDGSSISNTYLGKDVAMKILGQSYSGGIFSYGNSYALNSNTFNAPAYVPNKTIFTKPTLNLVMAESSILVRDPNDDTKGYCVLEDGSVLVGFDDTHTSFTIDLSQTTIVKDGQNLVYTMMLNGESIASISSIVVNAVGEKTLTLRVSEFGYDVSGNYVETGNYIDFNIAISSCNAAIPKPSFVINKYNSKSGNSYKFTTSEYTFYYVKSSKGSAETIPLFEGLSVRTYTSSTDYVDTDLTSTNTLPSDETLSIGSNYVYTFDDGSKMTIKVTGGFKSKVSSLYFTSYNNKIYVYPSNIDSDDGVRSGVGNQDFNTTVNYTYTDANGRSSETITVTRYNPASSNSSISNVSWATFDSAHGGGDACISQNALVLMPDGSYKKAGSLIPGESIMTFNHETGKLEASPILFNEDSDMDLVNSKVIKLCFDNGSKTDIVYEHGFFDLTTMKYEYITENNYHAFLGHEFASIDKKGDITSTKLISASLENELVKWCSFPTYKNLNAITDGMLSIPGGVSGLFNYFDYDSDLKYNQESMLRDINQYGLLSIEDFGGLIDEFTFEAYNGKYLSISLGKGLLTWDILQKYIDRYGGYTL